MGRKTDAADTESLTETAGRYMSRQRQTERAGQRQVFQRERRPLNRSAHVTRVSLKPLLRYRTLTPVQTSFSLFFSFSLSALISIFFTHTHSLLLSLSPSHTHTEATIHFRSLERSGTFFVANISVSDSCPDGHIPSATNGKCRLKYEVNDTIQVGG